MLAVLAVLLLAAPAAAQEPLALSATTAERGWVGLTVAAPAGLPVTVTEDGEPVASVTGPAALPHAAPWRCDRRVRRFVATAADGRTATTEARTPSCRDRLDVDAPDRARPGRTVRVAVRDRWGLGDVAAQVCVRPPGGPVDCRGAKLGTAALRVPVRVPRPGEWRVRVAVPWGDELEEVDVARRGGRQRMLVTGDSMIQPLDDFLEQRLRPLGMRVTSDPNISTGISKPTLLDWPAHARAEAARVRPDVTVVLLGANDGFPIGDIPCCGDAWSRAYAARVRGIMATLGRGGRGRVYWMTLPAPRGGFFRRTFPAVNAALRRAARAERRHARLIRLDRFFTPGGRYRATMRIGGQVRQVRQADGVHLSAAGAAAAAGLVVRALREERIAG